MGGDNKGGYAIMVWCTRCELKGLIAFQHHWVGREKSKMNDKWKTHKQCLIEVLACPCMWTSMCHQSLGDPFKHGALCIVLEWEHALEMLDYNMKYLPILNNRMLLWQIKEGWI